MRTINGVGGEAMKYDLLTVGFPIVEIMRKERGVSFEEPEIGRASCRERVCQYV